MTGKTTLLTTVCTWDLAAFQVFSTAPATSPLAANAVTLIAVIISATTATQSSVLIVFRFISHYLQLISQFLFRLLFGCGY